MKIFLNGQYQNIDSVGIHPNDRGFLFGDGVYEVVRIYNGRCFELPAHDKRIIESASAIGLDLAGFAGMGSVVDSLVANQPLPNGDGVLYYQITRGTAPRKHFFPEPKVPYNHYAYIQPLPVPDDQSRTGASVVCLPDRRWLECHIKSISLLGSVLAAQKAKEQNANEAILDRDGVVTEGSHTNVFAVIDGVLKTHPANNLILNGITRRVVLKLANENGIPHLEDSFTLAELQSASEVFLTGTTVEIWPVTQLNGQPVGTGQTGPITSSLQASFVRDVDRLP